MVDVPHADHVADGLALAPVVVLRSLDAHLELRDEENGIWVGRIEQVFTEVDGE